MSAAPTPVQPVTSVWDVMADTASRDEFGELARCCWDSHWAGRTAGYIEGFAAGRESVFGDIEHDVAEVARNAARSLDVMAARAKPYTTPAWAGERA